MTLPQLFDEWTTYEKVVTNDYMHQRDYMAELIARLPPGEAPAILVDLGCGDAQPVAPLIDAFSKVQYVGIDQSAEAICRAERLMASRRMRYKLLEGPMQDCVKVIKGPVDVIVASYSLHHLAESEKAAMLHHCRAMLGARGILAIIDVFMMERESRESYFRRWEAHATNAFHALSPHEIEQLILHVRDNDCPETVSTYETMARAAGFGSVIEVKLGAENLNRLLLIS